MLNSRALANSSLFSDCCNVYSKVKSNAPFTSCMSTSMGSQRFDSLLLRN